MTQSTRKRAKPPIIVSDIEHRQLTTLAASMEKRAPEVASALAAEMDRAKVVPAAKMPAHVIRMGSEVVYRSEESERRVTLVFPGDADIALGRISIATPIGSALIGLSPGQSITWMARDGREHQLMIVSVAQPAVDATAESESA